VTYNAPNAARRLGFRVPAARAELGTSRITTRVGIDHTSTKGRSPLLNASPGVPNRRILADKAAGNPLRIPRWLLVHTFGRRSKLDLRGPVGLFVSEA
jgi:hypothetical protein